jgi:hypothetical protein
MRYKLRDDVGRFEKYLPGQVIDEKDVPRYMNNYARLIEEVPEEYQVPVYPEADSDEDGDSE